MGHMSLPASLLGDDQWKTLDDLVGRVDEDRWLSSRYAPKPERRALTALYALNYELVRVPQHVSEPALGAIRYQWWRDTIGEIAEGKPARKHDGALALAETVAGGQLNAEALQRLVDAHEDAFEAGDRGREPEALLMAMAAGVFASAHGWGQHIQAVAPFFAASRRGDSQEIGPVVPPAPAAIRPAVAHARLRWSYSRTREPGRIARRIVILRAMMRGRV